MNTAVHDFADDISSEMSWATAWVPERSPRAVAPMTSAASAATRASASDAWASHLDDPPAVELPLAATRSALARWIESMMSEYASLIACGALPAPGRMARAWLTCPTDRSRLRATVEAGWLPIS